MPGYLASKETLANLRRRATVGVLMRQIEKGDWKRFLLEMKKAAHKYKKIKSHSGDIDPLLMKLNVVRMAIRLQVAVLAGTPISLAFAEGFDGQREAVNKIRNESMFDALLMEITRVANIESFATLRVESLPNQGTVICTDPNSMMLAVGPDGPDRQPTVWERRWIIERKTQHETKRYLRVERHRAPNSIGMIEQEAYAIASTDLFQYLGDLKQVDLDVAIPDTVMEPVTLTGVPYPIIVRVVHEYQDGQPGMLMSEYDMDMLDMHAAALSRYDRTMEQHGSPKLRIGEGSVDKKSGKVAISDDAVIDPDKLVEYIQQGFDFESQLKFMNKTVQMLLTLLQTSPALVGVKLEGGAMPDTVDKLRLEATNTLSRGRTSAMYFTPALERVFTIASIVDAQRPLQGYPIGRVGVTMHPGLPQDPQDVAKAMQELRSGGIDPLIDLRTALETIHGQAAGENIHNRLKEEKEEQLKHDQAALMVGIAQGPGGVV